MTITEYKYAAATVRALMAAEAAMASVNCVAANVTRAQGNRRAVTVVGASCMAKWPTPFRKSNTMKTCVHCFLPARDAAFVPVRICPIAPWRRARTDWTSASLWRTATTR